MLFNYLILTHFTLKKGLNAHKIYLFKHIKRLFLHSCKTLLMAGERVNVAVIKEVSDAAFGLSAFCIYGVFGNAESVNLMFFDK